MIETIKSILLDFQEVPLETGVPRRLKVEAVPGKATVCIGVRRSGKSTYLFQIIDRLLKFREFLDFKGIDSAGALSTKKRLTI